MKRTFFAVLIMFAVGLMMECFLPVTLKAQAVPDRVGMREKVAKDTKRYRDMLGVAIPMSDGKSLMADIFLPASEGRFPTIYIHTPYNRQYGGAPLPDELLATELLDREHYAYVIVDWRGFFGSKKAAEGVKRIDHGQDGYDVIEWIAKQSWSNGKVGMWGISAVGAVQYQIAMKRPPHLVCAVPASANIGFPYRQFYYGGVLERYYTSVFQHVGHGMQKVIMSHPTEDSFWQSVDAKAKSAKSNIDIPMLFITGWYDTHTALKIETFKEIRSLAKRYGDEMKLIIGPWLHTAIGKEKQGALSYPEAASYADRETMRFFDFYLRDQKDNGWDKEPPVRYFQMGSNEWKGTTDWPPKTVKVLYYLRAGGRLAKERPGDEAPDVYVYNPQNPTPTVGGSLIEIKKARLKVPVGPQDLSEKVESREDVVTYTTSVLSEDVIVSGDVKVKLYVSSDREDTDFAVRLSDVYPDGRSMLVVDGIWRMRFRKSTKEAQLMKPGQKYEVTIPLGPTAQTFLKGHRIRISISSSNFPRFDINPNIGRKRLLGPRFQVATNTIYHDSVYPSALILPVAVEDQGDI